MKRLGAIDIGTNTALLLLAEVKADEIIPIYEEEQIVRLGEGVDENRNLKDAAIARVVAAVEEYAEIAKEHKTAELIISGTSAVRDAANRSVLIEQIREKTGIEMRVLTGDEEAKLTHRGALSNKTKLDGKILMFDIGGGSTEFISGTRDEIKQTVSLDIGSVRLTERFVKHDPIAADEFAAIQNFVKTQLQPVLKDWQLNSEHFIGVAGTITTLAAMRLQMRDYDSGRIDGLELRRTDIENMIEMLKSKTLAERQVIPGLKPKRADVILAGALILFEAMNHFRFEKMRVSDRGLRYGLLLDS